MPAVSSSPTPRPSSTPPTQPLTPAEPTDDLLDHLATIEDPRDLRGRRYSLPTLLALAVCPDPAVSCSLWACQRAPSPAASTSPMHTPCATCSDRKSTRLNSSHVSTSYAVFCLKQTNSPPAAR